MVANNTLKKEFSYYSSTRHPQRCKLLWLLWLQWWFISKHSSPTHHPKALYLAENVDNTCAIHLSPTRHLFRVTSELAMQLILYQNDILPMGDEWVTSETKWITAATLWHIKLYNAMGDELQSSVKILFFVNSTLPLLQIPSDSLANPM